eukprot:GFUD01137982.1.p1 GENE.GFUD01137982.1~~GFUD01137982.1.p1  ORF type:complete len:579 (-),score=133.44 GFUD01137982.1:161-1834(-)
MNQDQDESPPPLFSSKRDVWTHICSLVTKQHTWCATTRPAPSPGKTPSFLGSFAAVARFASLPELQRSSTVCLSPGPFRDELRDTVLEEEFERTLLEPSSKGLLGQYQELVRVGAGDLVSLGLVEPGIIEVDMLVVGSMAVDRKGYRVGKEGDLTGVDFILGELGKSKCVVVTLVHDCQVFDSIPPNILTSHDLPVDIIVTPTKVITVTDKVVKPVDISWSLLKNVLVKRVPLLLERKVKDASKRINVKLSSSRRKCGALIEGDGKDDVEVKHSSLGEAEGVNNIDVSKIRRNQMNMESRFKFDNIPSSVGYSELKEVLKEREIVPGFCVVTLRKGSAVVAFKEESGEVVNKLKNLKIKLSSIQMEEVSEGEVKKNVKAEFDEKKKHVESIRSKMLSGTVDMLRSLNLTGIFIGNLANAVIEADIRKALEAHNQVAVHLELGTRSRFAIAFFDEELRVLLSTLENLVIHGKECRVKEFKPKGEQKADLKVKSPVAKADSTVQLKTDSPANVYGLRRLSQQQEEVNLFNVFGVSQLALFGPTTSTFSENGRIIENNRV